MTFPVFLNSFSYLLKIEFRFCALCLEYGPRPATSGRIRDLGHVHVLLVQHAFLTHLSRTGKKSYLSYYFTIIFSCSCFTIMAKCNRIYNEGFEENDRFTVVCPRCRQNRPNSGHFALLFCPVREENVPFFFF